MTETIKKFIEDNIETLENNSLWKALQNYEGPESSIIELVDILNTSNIDFSYTNTSRENIYLALKQVFEKQVNGISGYKITVKLLQNKIKIEVSTNMGQMSPSVVKEKTAEAESRILNVLTSIERVCKALQLPVIRSEFKVEDRWGQRYYRAITCRQAIYIKV